MGYVATRQREQELQNTGSMELMWRLLEYPLTLKVFKITATAVHGQVVPAMISGPNIYHRNPISG